jgi:iron complex transport system ATP-binding protein
MTGRPVITTSDLSIGYPLKGGRRKIINAGLRLQVYPGEVACLLGLNGAGKSTLLRTLCGFQAPLEGNIQINGKPLASYTQSALSILLGVVLTDKTNAGGITVYDLVSLGRHPYTGFFGQLEAHDHDIICKSLEAVGISHKSGNYVSELSDGERQKVMIAKTLAQECPVIILDEPTAFLDVTSRIETMVLLRQLAVKQNKAILLSTHDLDLAIQMGDRLWLLEKRRPLIQGTPEDLILSGAFESFFQKEGIVFDQATGKLNIEKPDKPIGVEGDFITACWVGNALVRNGYRPTVFGNSYMNINCVSREKITVSCPDGRKITAGSVQELLQFILSLKNPSSRPLQITGYAAYDEG